MTCVAASKGTCESNVVVYEKEDTNKSRAEGFQSPLGQPAVH